MQLAYKPDFDDACRRWEAFWQGEVIDRPCVIAVVPKDGADPVEPPPYPTRPGDDFQALAEAFDRYAAAQCWMAEAIPCMGTSFGPDQFAGFMGAEIDYSTSENTATSWAVPFVESWEDVLPLEFDGSNLLWRKMQRYIRTAASVGDGKFLLKHLDYHSNLDALAAIRGNERICMDLYDMPDLIERALEAAFGVYTQVYEGVHEAARMDERGSLGSHPFYCRGRSATIQCDALALIGPEHGKRFVIPYLEREAAWLDRCDMHFDGPGSLPHLDNVLAIKEIDAFQWVSGAGQPPMHTWKDVLHRAYDAGKGLDIYGVTPEKVKELHREFGPEQMLYAVRAQSRQEIEHLLKWLVAHT